MLNAIPWPPRVQLALSLTPLGPLIAIHSLIATLGQLGLWITARTIHNLAQINSYPGAVIRNLRRNPKITPTRVTAYRVIYRTILLYLATEGNIMWHWVTFSNWGQYPVTYCCIQLPSVLQHNATLIYIIQWIYLVTTENYIRWWKDHCRVVSLNHNSNPNPKDLGLFAMLYCSVLTIIWHSAVVALLVGL